MKEVERKEKNKRKEVEQEKLRDIQKWMGLYRWREQENRQRQGDSWKIIKGYRERDRLVTMPERVC